MRRFASLAAMALLFLLCLSCSSQDHPDTGNPGANYLRCKVDGQDWIADSDIFGAFHPQGYNKAILIAGSLGPKDKNEQTFNINLYNADGVGTYQIQAGNADNSAAQLANLSAEHYLYGNLLGFNMKVTITKASSNPTIVEATFEGTMNGNASDVIQITEGRFYYRE